MIEKLIARELAYQAEDKSVYFRINRFPEYGHLAHFDLSELRSTGRVKSDEYDKEHVGDFALWKAWDEEDGDVWWESSCSAAHEFSAKSCNNRSTGQQACSYG